MSDMNESLVRAIKLLKTPPNSSEYVILKIGPTVRKCCCFHCWPETWAFVNEYILPCGPLQDEGDVLIKKNNEQFVLECHESGPEIVYYIGIGTASLLLIKSIVELIVALLKALEKERGKKVGSLKIIKRRIIKGDMNEEQIIEINLPLNESTIKSLDKKIKNALRSHNKKYE